VPALPRRQLKQSGPPWVVLGVVVAGAAALAVTLALVLPGAPASPSPSARAGAARKPPSGSAARVPLAELTTRLIMDRAEDAGYEITNNSTTDSGSITTTSVGVSKSSRTGFVIVYRCKEAETARSVEDSFRKVSAYAVTREGSVVLAAMVNNGADPGNEGSRRLLAAVVR
jgi:hypothetical protein